MDFNSVSCVLFDLPLNLIMDSGASALVMLDDGCVSWVEVVRRRFDQEGMGSRGTSLDALGVDERFKWHYIASSLVFVLTTSRLPPVTLF